MNMSAKFYIGVFLIVTNFIVAKIALLVGTAKMSWGIYTYLFSWLMLFAGLLFCGKEGWEYSKTIYKQGEKKLFSKFHKPNRRAAAYQKPAWRVAKKNSGDCSSRKKTLQHRPLL
jgi:hypothetical protein